MSLVYRFRGWLMVPPMVFVVLCTSAECENDLWNFSVGGLVFAAGLLLRIWAQTHLHYRLTTCRPLTRTGPYALVRNPMYLGNTLMLVAMCLLLELPRFAPVQLAYCVVVYSGVVRYEEAHLARKYGDAYLDYLARVPRWLPGLRRAGAFRREAPRYLWPSVLAEAHNLFLLVPVIAKEVIVR